MEKDIAKRAFDNSIEYLYEKGWLHFPKKFGVVLEFRVTNYNKGLLSFEVRNGANVIGSYVSCIAWDLVYDLHLKKEDVNMNYAMAIFIRHLSKEMFQRI